MKNRCGFTFVELISVIAIIVILLSIVVIGGSNARTRARMGQAKSEIAALEAAINAYRTDVGTFPVDPQGASVNADTVRQLGGLDASGAVIASLPNDWNGPYMEFDRSRLASGSGEFLDPWGNAYKILGIGDDIGTTAANLTNKYTFDIISFGPDGQDNDGAEASDDIANF